MLSQVHICQITHLSKLIKCTTLEVKPAENDHLWKVMMCRWRCTDCNKGATPTQVFNGGEVCVCGGREYTGTLLS